MIINIVMCEGAHDIGFISKIMFTNGFKPYKKKIKEYPSPINAQIEENIKKSAVGDRKIGFEPPSYKIPYASLIKDELLLLFHNMGGDNNCDNRKELINDYKTIMDAINDVFDDKSISEIKFFLFFDADDKGVKNRIEAIRNDYSDEYKIPKDQIENGKISSDGNIRLGTYIFHDTNDSAKKGTLEEQLLGLIKHENKEIIDAAEEYLDKNSLASERTKEYLVSDGKYKGVSKFNKKKSIISVAGQLQFSGMNNSVIIAKSDYIKESVISNDNECKIICKLLAQ